MAPPRRLSWIPAASPTGPRDDERRGSSRAATATALAAIAAVTALACCESDDADDARPGNGPTTTAATTGAGATTAGGGGAGTGGSTTSGGGGTGGQGGVACPAGVICVDTFPFRHEGNTTGGPSTLDGYSCSPSTDESGPEIRYLVTVPTAGFLSAAVYDGDGVDVDVHLLTADDAGTCLDRGNRDANADVTAGSYWVVVDTWVDPDGVELSGPYRVDIGFTVPSEGSCAMEVGEMDRVGDNGVPLPMPATGPIVMEAHLVTQQEPAPYPSTATEELAEHYELSQATTGFVMYREQVWAPLEGGSFYGAGIGSPTDFPVLDEGWYVNMYWTSAARPAKGTRMILRDPVDPTRAVVVAAGYETGPGNLAHIGGTPEETHYYLRSGHLTELTLGIASDPTLPLGPRRCTD